MPDDTAPDFEFKELPAPTQCELWEQPDLVTTPRGRFETVESFTEGSHLKRALLKCRECGQLYFYEFYERVDWNDGDDAQYSTYIPVPARETALEIDKQNNMGLMLYSPRLQWDHPTGKPAALRWIGK